MDIMSKLFGPKPTQQQQTLPGNMPAQPTQTASAGNGMVPAGSEAAPVAAPTEPKSGLDAFNELWNTAPTEPGAQANTSMFNVDQTKLLAAANKANFAKSINPELLAKVAAGGEDAVRALPEILNAVAANTFAQSTTTQTRIIEQALAQQRAEMLAEIPGLIKQQNVSDNLRTKNPIFNHPAAAPMLAAIQQQMATKFPNATANELQQKAEEYLTSFADAASPQKVVAPSSGNGTDATDWSKFLE